MDQPLESAFATGIDIEVDSQPTVAVANKRKL
jgi:hypothetical protein